MNLWSLDAGAGKLAGLAADAPLPRGTVADAG